MTADQKHADLSDERFEEAYEAAVKAAAAVPLSSTADQVNRAAIAAVLDFADRRAAQPISAKQDPVGETGPMPGSNGGFTMAVFEAAKVPNGTRLYAAQPETTVAITDAAARLLRDTFLYEICRDDDTRITLGQLAALEKVVDRVLPHALAALGSQSNDR